MRKTLFLLCPTDCLESIINQRTSCENYFYTSLGNSFHMDPKTLECLKALITKHQIKDIYFVLSDDNKIVMDALTQQNFSDIKGLKAFYKAIAIQRNESKLLWTSKDAHFALLSYYLNTKIKALQQELTCVTESSLAIKGKIYHRKNHTFKAIYSDLICLKRQYLN